MITQQIACDVCGKQKRDVNHWWIAKPTAMDFTFLPWGSGAVNNSIAQHLCGQECATKALNVWMQDYLNRGNNIQP